MQPSAAMAAKQMVRSAKVEARALRNFSTLGSTLHQKHFLPAPVVMEHLEACVNCMLSMF